MSDETLRCRRCGARVTKGLVATSLRHCCLSPSGIGGVCPDHGPLAPHDVVRGDEGDARGGADGG
ncbi:MAG: hypothetical protein ABEH78_08380 [Haloferacaceae archaeon]